MTAIIPAIFFTLCGIAALAFYIPLRIKKDLNKGILFKIATSVFFLLTAGASVAASSGAVWEQYKYLFLGIVFGQIFGLLGDYWLDMKDMLPAAHHDRYTFTGFISFFICHLFFNAGLVAAYGTDWKKLLVILGAGAVLCAFVMGTEKLMKLKYGKFKGITAGYSVVFGMSIAAALFSWLYGGRNPQALVMAIGLVVFLLSDLVLSGTYFGEGKDKPIDITLNYIFYYGGQFTIALSLLALKN